MSSGSICSLCVSTNVAVGEPLSDVAGQKGVSIADGRVRDMCVSAASTLCVLRRRGRAGLLLGRGG